MDKFDRYRFDIFGGPFSVLNDNIKELYDSSTFQYLSDNGVIDNHRLVNDFRYMGFDKVQENLSEKLLPKMGLFSRTERSPLDDWPVTDLQSSLLRGFVGFNK